MPKEDRDPKKWHSGETRTGGSISFHTALWIRFESRVSLLNQKSLDDFILA